MATLKINFIYVIVAAVFISKAACLHPASASKGLDTVKMELRTMCNKSEADTQFSVFVDETLSNFETCVNESLIAENDDQYNFKYLNSKVKSICYRGPSTIKCSHNMIKSFEFCYNETQFKKDEKSLEFCDQFLVLMCSDKGQQIISLFDNKEECISNRTDLKSCVKPELDIIETFENSNSSSSPIQFTNQMSYLLSNCTRIQEIETCIVEEISQCDDENVQISTENSPTFYSLENTTRQIFSLLKNVMECKNNEVQANKIKKINEVEANMIKKNDEVQANIIKKNDEVQAIIIKKINKVQANIIKKNDEVQAIIIKKNDEVQAIIIKKKNEVQETPISTTSETVLQPVVIIIYISLCMFIITIFFIIIIISINRMKYIPYSHFDK